MTANMPHRPRNCGECEECCHVIVIAELNKPYHTRCVHQTGKGCAIYGSHPVECRDYGCAWLQGILPEEMRPDRIGILVDAEGGDEWAVMQECRQGALDSPVGRELIKWLSGLARNLRRGVRIEPYGAHKGVAATGERLPGLFKRLLRRYSCTSALTKGALGRLLMHNQGDRLARAGMTCARVARAKSTSTAV